MKTTPKIWLFAIAFPLILAGCGGGEDAKASKSREYDIRGKVTAVNPGKSEVRIDHEDIPGMMQAMEMNFQVQEPKALEGIKVGDQVQGRVKKAESGLVLTKLEKRADH